MKYTIISKKYGKIVIDYNDDFSVMELPTDHPLFQFVEEMFDEWYEGSVSDPHYAFAKDIEEAYSDGGTCIKKGAIQGGIEGIFEQMYENGVTFVTQETIENKYDILTTFMP